jgi:transposase
MPSMTSNMRPVTGGVDTHGDTHHAAVIDEVGRELGDAEFPATPGGYRQLLAWLRRFGVPARIGVEGTGAYGAGLARHLRRSGVVLVEVDRPDRKTRRSKGKSDPVDAYAAARAALSGVASGSPKTRDGLVEAIRALRVARRGAVKARTQTMNQLKCLLITAPEGLREQLRHLSSSDLIDTCARLRPQAAGADLPGCQDPVLATTKAALRRLAARHQQLRAEVREHDADLAALVAAAAPKLLSLQGVGPEVAGQLLSTAGDNPERLRSEAALAHLCGAAPIPASSGRTRRHRFNRGGDRAANNALYTIVLCRLRYDPATRAYFARRTKEGLSRNEIIRCLKRYVVRDVFQALQAT